MENKMIHKDEFRLRLLLTNMCNKNCYFCLNDFQKKPDGIVKPMFLDTRIAVKVIEAYCSFMLKKAEQPIVTFSGGEPGLHTGLQYLARVAMSNDAITKIVTNGFAFSLLANLLDLPCWHVGVTDIQYIPSVRGTVVIQIVVTTKMSQYQLEELVAYYTHHGYIVKLFEDFYDRTYPKTYKEYEMDMHKKIDNN